MNSTTITVGGVQDYARGQRLFFAGLRYVITHVNGPVLTVRNYRWYDAVHDGALRVWRRIVRVFVALPQDSR